jgi:hypothetical protein
MRGVLTCVSATVLVSALAGCVELIRKSGTRASIAPPTGSDSLSRDVSSLADTSRPAGSRHPFNLEMRSGELVVTVEFSPRRSGPRLLGPILPLVPMRLRPERSDSGALLLMTVGVTSPTDPVMLDLTAVRVHLPDGQILRPMCDSKRVSLNWTCAIRVARLPGTGGHACFVTLPLPVDGNRHTSLEIELPVAEVGGRRIVLPRITATHITKWLLHWARA